MTKLSQNAKSPRGYNESGKPEGIDAYHMENLVDDVKCLVKELGVEKFTLVRFYRTLNVKTWKKRFKFKTFF